MHLTSCPVTLSASLLMSGMGEDAVWGSCNLFPLVRSSPGRM